MFYEALEVREYTKTSKATFFNGLSGTSGEIHVNQHLRIVVIAKDLKTKERVRFEFFEAYEFEFGDKTHYGGYLGDYALLISGDLFRIEKTSAQDKVVICTS